MLEMLGAVISKLLRVVFTLVGVTLATGLVVLGLVMAGVLALVARLSGRPLVFRRVNMPGGFRGPFQPPFGARSRAGRAPGGEVIDAEVREVSAGSEAARVIELDAELPRRTPDDRGER